MERLDILNQSNDGFYIASQDLKLRGPGELFGVRQSGDFSFQIGDIYTDAAILQQASEAVEELLRQDSGLVREENRLLKQHYAAMGNSVDFRSI
jgi:ATP-dependent DNA helicase RecG